MCIKRMIFYSATIFIVNTQLNIHRICSSTIEHSASKKVVQSESSATKVAWVLFSLRNSQKCVPITNACELHATIYFYLLSNCECSTRQKLPIMCLYFLFLQLFKFYLIHFLDFDVYTVFVFTRNSSCAHMRVL